MSDRESGTRAEHDYTSRGGAEILRNNIEAYWAEKRRKVTVHVIPEKIGLQPGSRILRRFYSVRSNMINGVPQR